MTLRRDGSLAVVVELVPDTTPPVVQLPSGGYVRAQATSPEGAVVNFTVTATDDDDPDPLVVCAPPSGSFFPLGGTDVWCTASDDAGNRSEPVHFTVWVESASKQTPIRNDAGQRAIWTAEHRAIRYAMSKGVVVVASQGNDNIDLSKRNTDVISPDYPPGSEIEPR